jgi:S-sulfo-L-cysteine synthase (O-acetyl-L-serine-dependent)
MLGAAKGNRVKLAMPACVSLERRAVLQAYGAALVHSPAGEGTDGAIRLARRILAEEPDRYCMPNQCANPDNVRAHYETTGPEILAGAGGEVDGFVAGMGTGGALMGVARYLREKRPGTGIVGVEPTFGHTIQGLKNMKEAIVPPNYREEALDGKIVVADELAFEMARRLAVEEGLFVGMSSGAAVAGAVEVAGSHASGTVVALLPDRGDRYLSTSLFRSMRASCPSLGQGGPDGIRVTSKGFPLLPGYPPSIPSPSLHPGFWSIPGSCRGPAPRPSPPSWRFS